MHIMTGELNKDAQKPLFKIKCPQIDRIKSMFNHSSLLSYARAGVIFAL